MEEQNQINYDLQLARLRTDGSLVAIMVTVGILVAHAGLKETVAKALTLVAEVPPTAAYDETQYRTYIDAIRAASANILIGTTSKT